jgi:threonine/homoserine/homoserine lactone efflux protein
MLNQVAQPFLTGAAISIGVAAPIGPVALSCIRQTIVGGLRPGVAGGLGAATVHVLFGTLGLSGLLAAGEIPWLSHSAAEFAGGVIVALLALRSLLNVHIADTIHRGAAGTVGSAYISTVLLALSNPLTIIGLAAAVSSFGLAGTDGLWLIATGMFCGSASWWIVLCGAVAACRRRVSPRVLIWISRSASVLMAAGGVLSIFRSCS